LKSKIENASQEYKEVSQYQEKEITRLEELVLEL